MKGRGRKPLGSGSTGEGHFWSTRQHSAMQRRTQATVSQRKDAATEDTDFGFSPFPQSARQTEFPRALPVLEPPASIRALVVVPLFGMPDAHATDMASHVGEERVA